MNELVKIAESFLKMSEILTPYCLVSFERSYILRETFGFQLQVCLSMFKLINLGFYR